MGVNRAETTNRSRNWKPRKVPTRKAGTVASRNPRQGAINQLQISGRDHVLDRRTVLRLCFRIIHNTTDRRCSFVIACTTPSIYLHSFCYSFKRPQMVRFDFSFRTEFQECHDDINVCHTWSASRDTVSASTTKVATHRDGKRDEMHAVSME